MSQAQSDGCGAALSFLPLPMAVPKKQAAQRGEGTSTYIAAQSAVKWGFGVVAERPRVSLALALGVSR